MTNYRRDYTAGAVYFFTLNLANRNSNLLIDQIDLLRNSFSKVKLNHPFTINSIVILPNHLHCVLTLPSNDSDYSKRVRLVKTYFTKGLTLANTLSKSQISKKERVFWQRRFWEHKIRDERDYINHVHYCYINPVKHQLVTSVKDWPYSSFHRDVKLGLFSNDWADGVNIESSCSFGELKN